MSAPATNLINLLVDLLLSLDIKEMDKLKKWDNKSISHLDYDNPQFNPIVSISVNMKYLVDTGLINLLDPKRYEELQVKETYEKFLVSLKHIMQVISYSENTTYQISKDHPELDN